MQDLNYSTSTTAIEDIDRTVRNDNNHNITSTGVDEVRDTLARLIAEHPFNQVVATLARVCHAKAQAIRRDTIDVNLAQAWEANGARIDHLARTAVPTEPTITLRCGQLGGVAPEDVLRLIKALPEPTRGLVHDYIHGAIPTLNRKSTLRDLVRDTMRQIHAQILTERAAVQATAVAEDDVEARRRAA